MVPVEGRGGGGVGAHAVEEVAAVLVHEVVDVDCFVLFFFYYSSLLVVWEVVSVVWM